MRTKLSLGTPGPRVDAPQGRPTLSHITEAHRQLSVSASGAMGVAWNWLAIDVAMSAPITNQSMHLAARVIWSMHAQSAANDQRPHGVVDR